VEKDQFYFSSFYIDDLLVTECELHVHYDKINAEYNQQIIFKGRAVKHPSDQLYRAFGRKLALRRATENAMVKVPNFDKCRRKALWDKFYSYKSNKSLLKRK